MSELTIPSTVAAIDDARRWLAAQLRREGLDDDEVWEAELAMTEALSNIVRHAYGSDRERKVKLALSLDPRRLELTIVHWGAPFDEERYAAPDLGLPGPGGYGVHLIGRLMDEVSHGPAADGGSQVRLVKHRWKEQA